MVRSCIYFWKILFLFLSVVSVCSLTMAEERSRKAAKGWLTRVKDKGDKLLSIPATERGQDWRLEVSVVLDELHQRLSAFDEAQRNVELVIDEDMLLDDIEKSGAFRDIVCKLRARLVAESQTGAPSGSRAGAEVKLPKLDLPTFDGKVERWLFFWESFQACVHNSDLPDVQKLTYLRSFLKGEAAKSVEGLALTSSNYDAAVEILSQRYGRPEKLVFLHIQSLLSLKEPNLVALQDTLLSHIRSLESLGVSGEKYGVILTPLVLSRLPEAVRLEWARDSEHHEGDLSYLVKFIDGEIRRQERSGHCSGVGSPGGEVATGSESLPARPNRLSSSARFGMVTRWGSRSRREPSPTAAALAASAEPGGRCGICSQRHTTSGCPSLLKLSAGERHLEIKNRGLCFRCLLSGHKAADCEDSCDFCNGGHHAVLCYRGA